MDFTGMCLLGTRYSIDQELTMQERTDQLRQGERLDVDPIYELCAVKVNSTYLESVDRYYAWRGYLFFMMLTLASGLLIFYGMFLESCISGLPEATRTDDQVANGWSLVFINVICLPPLAFLIYAALQESFTRTYFPIRLSRKNGKLYVFRPGRPSRAILVVDWDKLFFTLGACNVGLVPGENWDIRCHVLDKHRKTVIDTFSFSVYTMSKEKLRRHWEFLRRYMEEGPREAFDQVEVCMPVANSRESLRFAYLRFRVNFKGAAGLWTLLFPLWLASILGRWVAGLTCSIPSWPADIEAACRVETNDPYAKDASTNPAYL